MGGNSRKRPCSICRKWFRPDVRQVGRQRTCCAECSKELHRRQCEDWNNSNKSYFKNNYLSKKIEEQTVPAPTATISSPQVKPVLPIEIIVSEYGVKSAIIIRYLVAQIIDHANGSSTGFS